MRTLAVAWSVGWVAFFLGWKFGRREFAYWLVRHPEWKGLRGDLNDGSGVGGESGRESVDPSAPELNDGTGSAG